MSAAQRETVRPFTVDVEPERDVVRVCPRGDVDLATVDLLRDQVDQLISAGFLRVLLDLRGVTFLDSTGLTLLVEMYRASRARRWELGVVEGPPEVQRLLDITGLRAVLPVVDTSALATPHWGRACP
jgi:anti-sigma B factor antagonist